MRWSRAEKPVPQSVKGTGRNREARADRRAGTRLSTGIHVVERVAALCNGPTRDAERMRAYGATETIDHTAAALAGAVRQAHPDGIDVLIDLVNAVPADFAALASLVRPGGTAVTTQYVADQDALRAAEITGINFALPMSSELLQRVAEAVADGRILAPPITRISLEEAIAALDPAQARPASGKTVITF